MRNFRRMSDKKIHKIWDDNIFIDKKDIKLFRKELVRRGFVSQEEIDTHYTLSPIDEKTVTKVYCKNCQYLSGGVFSDCVHPTNLLDSYFTNNHYVDKKPSIINKSNSCLNYKRKWYKFWVK
jgi:hypothetical protein